MARPKKPIDLHMAGGNQSRLTKAEIERRQATEVKAPAGSIDPPSHLSERQQAEYRKYAQLLIDIEIFSALDAETLGAWIRAKDEYIILTLARAELTENFDINDANTFKKLDAISRIEERAFRQMRAAASDLGLTVSSRSRLVVPKKDTEPQANKFARFETR